MKRFLIGFILLFICMVVVVTEFQRGMGPHTSDTNLILNRLRAIDAAKESWVTAHPNVKAGELRQQDLTPYLNGDFWKKSVAGEAYLIHSATEPAEAQLTKHVDSIPENASVRWGPDGDIQIRTNRSVQWPNKLLQPTATAPLVSTNK